MFNKGKEKKNKNEENDLAAKKEAELEKKISKDVEIHTMPKKLQNVKVGYSSSKKAGFLIIGGGFLLLVIMAFVFYYVLFAPSGDKQTENNIKETEEPQEEEESTPAPVEEEDSANNLLPIEEEDSSVATSTTDLATSTNEEEGPEFEVDQEETTGMFDTDQDGLSDKEEELLGSDPEKIDSDGDGYGDLSELMNLYNPSGDGPLVENENIDEFKSDVYGYSVLYPAEWSFSMIGDAEDSLVIRSDDNHFLRLIVEPNPDFQSIDNWYKEQFNVDNIEDQYKESSSLWEGIRSDDDLILYLTDLKRNYIFILSYTPTGESLDYQNIFEMMIKSFSI